MSRNDGSNFAEMTLAFLVGAVAGAAVALLFAPASGRETRELLGQKAREGQDKAADLAREAWASQRDNVAAAIERGREVFQQVREKGTV
jgi:gas vesicle protein